MTECTVHQAAEAFIGYLRESGKKERTLYTYRKDLDAVEAFFGADRQLAEIRLPQVGKFYKSDLLLKLPDGKVLMPGVIDSVTLFVEHPELVAQRITRYANIVGRENVIAGSDCELSLR